MKTSGGGKPIDAETLTAILESHDEWLATEGRSGARADLTAGDLRGKSLWEADLTGTVHETPPRLGAHGAAREDER